MIRSPGLATSIAAWIESVAATWVGALPPMVTVTVSTDCLPLPAVMNAEVGLEDPIGMSVERGVEQVARGRAPVVLTEHRERRLVAHHGHALLDDLLQLELGSIHVAHQDSHLS